MKAKRCQLRCEVFQELYIHLCPAAGHLHAQLYSPAYIRCNEPLLQSIKSCTVAVGFQVSRTRDSTLFHLSCVQRMEKGPLCVREAAPRL